MRDDAPVGPELRHIDLELARGPLEGVLQADAPAGAVWSRPAAGAASAPPGEGALPPKRLEKKSLNSDSVLLAEAKVLVAETLPRRRAEVLPRAAKALPKAS